LWGSKWRPFQHSTGRVFCIYCSFDRLDT
jgi:hypothetical protein